MPDIDLAKILRDAGQKLETLTLEKLTEVTRAGLDAGLSAIKGATDKTASASTPGNASWWDKIKSAFSSGVAGSDLGKAATFATVVNNPFFVAAVIAGAALLLYKVSRRKK
jgi:hypothetical protein